MSSGSAAGTAAVLSMMGASTGSGGGGGGGAGSLASSSSATSYSNERPGGGGGAITGGLDVEYASDPASGGFFHADYKKHDDLKQMLDSNKDSLKLEAMKRIIAMVAKGRDASDLFPAVVKNVVSKNIEVKKLVYVYLVRYAEEQQDLALLSISTFQRALKDPNQLIRAGALRVLSSIRVSMIVPIVMLAIRDSASDMSPYVRKTAAHAIPKLYSLDAEQKDELIGVIEKLLADRTTLVVGSAVMAFEEVCPERVDLIHKNYRKLCNLLVDVDEWGQIIIINMLTRYARTQFVDPNRDDYDELGEGGGEGEAGKPFYDETTSDSDESDGEEETTDGVRHRDDDVTNGEDNSSANGPKMGAKKAGNRQSGAPKSPKKVVYQLDADHRLLLRQTKPLLQSRNASVVMTVAQLYHHVAPRCEVALVAKALIRLLRSHTEVQSVVLTSIASMSTQRHAIFEPYIKSFFVRTSSDPTHVKLLKLEILTNLANAASIGVILREFQQYISSSDKVFVAATIQAIGRCAASIREVTETCLAGLVHLLSNRDEYVVAESVVVIKQLLQTQRADHYEIISQMAKLLDFIAVAAARAAILWLIGEYNEKVPRIAPDVLRKLAKSFVDEQNIVKLQVLNLAVKLHLTNPAQTEQLAQYVFSLARYDPHYDVRDRARFLRQFVFPAAGQPTVLSRRAREIFLAAKPAPQLLSKYGGREQFQLGSLSHYLNVRATGYHEMPAFPEVAPDSGVRHVESPTAAANAVVFPVVQPGVESAKSVGSKAATSSSSGKKTSGGKKSSAAADKKSRAAFYSESEKSTTDYGSSSSSSSSEEEATGEAAKKASTSTVSPAKKKKSPSTATKNDKVLAASGTSDSEEDSSSSSSSESSSSASASASASASTSSGTSSSSEGSSSSSEDEAQPNTFSKAQKRAQKLNGQPKPAAPSASASASATAAKRSAAKSNLDLLLELDDIAPAGPIMTPSLGGFLTPSAAGPAHLSGLLLPNSSGGGAAAPRLEPIGPSHIPHERRELLSKLSGNGLAIACRFTRAPHLYSGAFVSVELAITNTLARPLNSIRLEAGAASISPAQPPLTGLAAGATATTVIGIDFGDSTQPVPLAVAAEDFAPARCQLRPTVGELVRSVRMSGAVFRDEAGKLRGMNEHQAQVRLPERVREVRALRQRVLEYANVALIGGDGDGSGGTDSSHGRRLQFAGQTLGSGSLVLLVVEMPSLPEEPAEAGAEATLSVSCEKMVIGSMALSELRAWLLAA